MVPFRKIHPASRLSCPQTRRFLHGTTHAASNAPCCSRIIRDFRFRCRDTWILQEPPAAGGSCIRISATSRGGRAAAALSLRSSNAKRSSGSGKHQARSQILYIAGETHGVRRSSTRGGLIQEFIAHVRVVYLRLRSKTLRGISTFPAADHLDQLRHKYRCHTPECALAWA